jgi:hypothetical protein
VERELTPAERRRFTRFACPPDASVRLRADLSARVLDLGLGGALVECPTRLVPGSVTPATLFVVPHVAFRAQAHIVRVFVSGVTRISSGGTSLVYRAGLEFEPLSPAEAGALRTLVSEASRTTSPSAAIPPDRPVSLRFPPGWARSKRKGAVVASAPDTRSYVFLGAPSGPQSCDLAEFARTSMHAAGFSLLHGQPAEINGLRAWVGFYSGSLDDLGVVVVEAAYVMLDSRTYLIAGVAPLAAYETVRDEFFATINSFEGQRAVDGACVVAAPSSPFAAGFDFSAASATGSIIQYGAGSP